ncbi:hypothetical protein H4S06_005389 [Coemansia sp. BCRC 34490]|nr:hypothetical protein H4S06_005389 [Coemansia sp. BCRC 34490]
MTEYAAFIGIKSKSSTAGSSTGASQAGGIILSSNFIITSAHSFLDSNNKAIDPSTLVVGYGSGLRSEQTNTTCTYIHIHPDFVTAKNTLDYRYDIALLEVPVLSLYSTSSMVKIYNGELYPRQKVLTVGWGKTGPTDTLLLGWLRGAITSVGYKNECTAYIDGYVSSNKAQICSFDFADTKAGANLGDAGSAIVVNDNGQTKLAGIASQIVYFTNPKGAVTGVAHVDINVNYHIQFIANITGLADSDYY